MRKVFFFSLFLVLSFFAFAPTAFAGVGIEGNGIVRLEACADSNLLINEALNNPNWPYRVSKPDHCIHIYPEGDALHQFYYTLPKEARLKTNYYGAGDYLGVFDALKDGTRVHYAFGITGGEDGSKTYLITDVVKPSIEPIEKAVFLTEEEKIAALDLKLVLYKPGEGFDGIKANNLIEHDIHAVPSDKSYKYKNTSLEQDGVLQSVAQQLFGNTSQLMFRQYPGVELKKYKDIQIAKKAFVERENWSNAAATLKLSNLGDEAICSVSGFVNFQNGERRILHSKVCAFRYKNIVLRIPFALKDSELFSSEEMKNKVFNFAQSVLVRFEQRMYQLIGKEANAGEVRVTEYSNQPPKDETVLSVLGIRGIGVVKFEECLDDNILILGEGKGNTQKWPHRVAKPDHCIHVYPTDKNYPHKMFYTLPKESRLKTGYYRKEDSLQALDALKEGTMISFIFGVTFDTSRDNCLTSDKRGDSYLINDHCADISVKEFNPEIKVRVIDDGSNSKPIPPAVTYVYPTEVVEPNVKDVSKEAPTITIINNAPQPTPTPPVLPSVGQGSTACAKSVSAPNACPSSAPTTPVPLPGPINDDIKVTPTTEPARHVAQPEPVILMSTPAPPIAISPVDTSVSGAASSNVTPLIKPTAASNSSSSAEAVMPVAIESGQEISAYYKTKLERVVSPKGTQQQIEELKILRDEIDGLISNLIQNRKEMEVSELNTLVKEVRVSQGEIRADMIAVKTTGNKLFVNVGSASVSIEPTANQVLIRDGDLEVHTSEAVIKGNILSVGGVDVKMSASEVVKKLGLTPKTTELKEENAKAIYSMQIQERRKLFGFISFTMQRTVEADAENGNIVGEHFPWYSFLTKKPQ